MIPLVLAGGVGSRLWPLSRGSYPKQFLPLMHEKWSMLQQTLQRTEGLTNLESPIIVCNQEHRFLVGEQLQQLSTTDATILLEPHGRNTAPAIALAAMWAIRDGSDPILLVMPADHCIENEAAFRRSVAAATDLVEQGCLLTFGIVPQGPETAYGYIKAGDALGCGYRVKEFKEKPDLAVAEKYIAEQDYFWNGGVFAFKATVYLGELQLFAPDVYQAAAQAMSGAYADLDFIRVDADSFAQSPSISIDYAVLEHTDKAVVVPLDVGWSDVGSWSALWEATDKDASGNVVHGDVLLHDTRNSHIYSESKLVTAVGIEDLIIVESDDAVMVSRRDQAQHVKNIVEQLQLENRSQANHHRKVYRPWGWYDLVDSGERFQVKRIQVNPGAKLSVQLHHHRAEHWVVVKGVAEVLNGEQTKQLNENESTYIPIGVKHALGNPSPTQFLEIIEVQSGDYLGEDDIVRFADLYGRSD